MSEAVPDVSLIVPVHNADAYFTRMLESVAGQESDAPVEVIVVHNRSRDRSREIAESFSSRLRLRLIDAPDRLNASYARNVGARAASADKLLFADADDELAPGYIAAMSAALDVHEFVMSRADCATLNPEWVRDAHGEPWVGILYDCCGFLPAAGPNVGLRSGLFRKSGGFPEKFTGSQDLAFAWLVQLRGGVTLELVADAVYRYRYRDSIWGLFRQTLNWGYSNAMLYRTFRNLGMPPRRVRTAVNDWADALVALAGARSKAQLAAATVQTGYCLGRMMGSVRYAVWYP